MSTERKFHVRQRMFLNLDPEFRAHVIGIVEDTTQYPTDENESWKWGDIVLSFADCARTVSFDFCLNNKAERANSLYKIRRIAKVVNAVHAAIEKEARSIAKRKPLPPKEEEPKANAASA